MMKKSLFLSLIIPLPLLASPCSGMVNHCSRDTLNNFYVCTAIGTHPYTIDMANYSEVIDNAIQGRPLNGDTPLAIPACVAEAMDANWTPIIPPSYSNFRINVTFNATTSNATYPQGAGFSVMEISSDNHPGYFLGANMSYCPCGDYNGSSCTATLPIDYAFNQTNNSVPYNDPASPFNLGYCDDNSEGAILLNIYAPVGQIPAAGTYSAAMGIDATPVKVTGAPKATAVFKP